MAKRINIYLQTITQKTKDRATRTQSKTGVNSGAPEWYAVPALLVDPSRATVEVL
jgi:hypothetical protein